MRKLILILEFDLEPCPPEWNQANTATSIYRLHFLSTSRVLLYRDTIDRVLFYIEMTVMMSDYPHKVLKLVCQAMVEIFANFVA